MHSYISVVTYYATSLWVAEIQADEPYRPQRTDGARGGSIVCPVGEGKAAAAAGEMCPVKGHLSRLVG